MSEGKIQQTGLFILLGRRHSNTYIIKEQGLLKWKILFLSIHLRYFNINFPFKYLSINSLIQHVCPLTKYTHRPLTLVQARSWQLHQDQKKGSGSHRLTRKSWVEEQHPLHIHTLYLIAGLNKNLLNEILSKEKKINSNLGKKINTNPEFEVWIKVDYIKFFLFKCFKLNNINKIPSIP